MSMKEVNLRPRNDNVLVRIVEIGQNDAGIAIPQISIQGKEFRVVAVGKNVVDLEPGLKVLMIGRQGTEYFPLPNSTDLIIIDQKNVVLVYEE